MLPLDRPLLIFDLETTGLGIGEDRIVEIAYEKIMPGGEVQASVERINPCMPIPPVASSVHGIYDDDVKDAPSFAKRSYELWSVFDGIDVGGFNVLGFDLPFLRAEFVTVGKNFDFSSRKVLDAKILYHKMQPRDGFAPRNLSAAYKLYCGKKHENAHSGAGDVRVTVEILENILERYPDLRNWDTIMELNGQKKLIDSMMNEHAPRIESLGSTGTLF